jgi:hypothetical protein
MKTIQKEKLTEVFIKTIKKLLPDIENRIKELNKKTNIPLYITGHSLGGAWAMIATQQLQQLPNLAATYTFGCPRTANDAFYTDVRSPVYRVVHRADIVTRIPFGYGLNIFIYILILATRFIPLNGTKIIAEWLRRKILGYTHYGHMIYLNGSVEKKSIKVRFAPNIFYLLHDFGSQMLTNFTNIGKDHFMDNYREKLRWYAIDRNK